MADYYYCDVCKEPLRDPNIGHGGACEAIRKLQKRVADLERAPIVGNFAAGPWTSLDTPPENGDIVIVATRDLSRGIVIRFTDAWAREVTGQLEVWAKLNAPEKP